MGHTGAMRDLGEHSTKIEFGAALSLFHHYNNSNSCCCWTCSARSVSLFCLYHDAREKNTQILTVSIDNNCIVSCANYCKVRSFPPSLLALLGSWLAVCFGQTVEIFLLVDSTGKSYGEFDCRSFRTNPCSTPPLPWWLNDPQ